MRTMSYRYPRSNSYPLYLLGTLFVALFFRFYIPQTQDTNLVSGFIGILTVLGIYCLAKALFNKQIAVVSGLLAAVSSWHVLFSRGSNPIILAPLLLVWMLYFFWRGVATGQFHFYMISSLLMGLGLYSSPYFLFIPIVIILTSLAYIQYIRRDIRPDGRLRYESTLIKMIPGASLIVVTSIFVLISVGFDSNPAYSLNLYDSAFVSVLTGPGLFLQNIGKTLALFNFSDVPLLLWPIGICFAGGFVRSWIKLLRMKVKHGHFSTVQTLVLSTFILALLPTILFYDSGNVLAIALIASPIVFIMSGEGMWWFFEKLNDWYHIRDPHKTEARVVSTFAIFLLLTAIAVTEYHRYFSDWARNPELINETRNVHK